MIEELFDNMAVLSDEEESRLANYKGQKLTVFDSNGNIVQDIDTRDLDLEKLKAKKALKLNTRDKMFKHFPLHKQLNFNELATEEKNSYSNIKAKYLNQYETLKAEVANSATTDDVERALQKFGDFK